MRQKMIMLCLVLVLLVSACGQQPEATTPVGDNPATELPPVEISPTEIPMETEALTYPGPLVEETVEATTYPAPDANVVSNPYPNPDTGVSNTSPYPGANQNTGNNIESPLTPIAGEETMVKAPVYLESSQVLAMETDPVQAGLVLIGALPTPCHMLRVNMVAPDAENKIFIEIYSVADPAGVCVQVLQPFETTVNLGSFASGTYTVWINGEQVGEYTQ